MQAVIGDFISTARLGRIQCGMHIDMVKDILGEPDDISLGRPPKIYKYGAIRFTVFDNKIVTVKILFVESYEEVPKKLKVADFEYFHLATHEEVKSYLTENRFEFFEDTRSWSESFFTLKVSPANVSLSFTEGKLMAITSSMPCWVMLYKAWVNDRRPAQWQRHWRLATILDMVGADEAVRKGQVSIPKF